MAPRSAPTYGLAKRRPSHSQSSVDGDLEQPIQRLKIARSNLSNHNLQIHHPGRPLQTLTSLYQAGAQLLALGDVRSPARPVERVREVEEVVLVCEEGEGRSEDASRVAGAARGGKGVCDQQKKGGCRITLRLTARRVTSTRGR